MMKFNLKKSIWNDYILMILILFPVIFSGFLIFFLIIEERDVWLLSTFVILITSFLILLYVRIRYIKSFLEGVTLQGVILGVGFFKDRGRIEYMYVYDQKNHKHGQAIMKNKYTTQLKQGQAIYVLKKKINHKTIIRDLNFDFHEQ